MEKKYAEIAFTDEVRKMQEKAGSRSSYARMEKKSYTDGLTESEASFIATQDSFYMATVGQNGYPYIQHRGGPKGFVKVLDSKRIGFIDFYGNKQFISTGNLTRDHKAAMIMVDYPSRTRLKLYVRGEVVELEGNTELYDQLTPGDYSFRAAGMIIFHIDAYDWNCPQHITRRYTLEQLEEFFIAQQARINELEKQIEQLKTEGR
ncbi:pyridoxamine 5'-phosphate oxidase family protein [Terrimonas sp. NA20]|uniref:Pyridoxamine 5'-phosphate oxidase family protein n=1 Tax=Terrimonas ginsenosidimutans TaxID=2908004 RepID=A0ABS9KS84_9BACT|nr:pyridoxamine 5'-phosphate oxidase family protein [Terrimonas ginsenosidimutans]MCG2615186.1 pyridoxamine 5'-phosphate oxidase family protein [Terrimonas ginsenosidimutans]